LSDQVVDGLDEAITMMNEGEVYLVTVPPQHAFGSEGSQQQLAFVPPNATVTFEVELVSIISKVNIIFKPNHTLASPLILRASEAHVTS
jgi:FKBP-type peptidyl-prolyl cis-trans isomerase 2